MESLHTQDGQFFIKSLAQFIRQHEKALANSLQLSINRRQTFQNAAAASPLSPTSPSTPTVSQGHVHTSLMSVFAQAGLSFSSYSIKSAHLTLTPHHLFFLLSRLEELGIAVGPMNVRTESLHSESAQANYVSFLQAPKVPKRGRSDADSIHSVSSVRSIVSLMGGFWSSIGLGTHGSKSEKTKAAIEADLKYLYSAFTKLPSLRLTADHRAQLIKGYEEFPFDTAVPLFVFKNVQQLDIIDMDFRQFQGWDRMADQLVFLTVKRGHLDDIEDLLTNIVLDDAERKRRRSTRIASEIPSTPSWTEPSTPPTPHALHGRTESDSGSPRNSLVFGSPHAREQSILPQDVSDRLKTHTTWGTDTASPKRPSSARPNSSYRHARSYSAKFKRTGSASSNSSDCATTPQRSESLANLTAGQILAASKWQRLKYLSLADNALTAVSARGFAPVANSLRSLNLSSNLFNEIPDSLATLTRLNSLDLSNCLIDTLHSLTRYPLPAITTLKLKSNRLSSLAGIERLVSLENLHLQDNRLTDPMETARLTGMPNMRKIWIKHNPLTKEFSDYRVTIMNLFRQTPGYIDDVIVDDLPPTYAERKLLAPRVPEVQHVPVPPLPKHVEVPIIVQHARPVTSRLTEREASVSYEANDSAGRRKRVPRRRIVDLAAKDERRTPKEEAAHERTRLTIDTQVHTVLDDGNQFASTPEEVELPPSDVPYTKSDPAVLPNMQSLTEGSSQDNYRVRIEALREEFGSNWLSALGSHNTQADHVCVHDVVQPQRTLHLPAASPVIVSAGRGSA